MSSKSPIPVNEWGLPPSLVPLSNHHPIDLAPYNFNSYPLIVDQYHGGHGEYLPHFGYVPQNSYAATVTGNTNQPVSTVATANKGGSTVTTTSTSDASTTTDTSKTVIGLPAASSSTTSTSSSSSEQSSVGVSTTSTDTRSGKVFYFDDDIKNNRNRNKDIVDVPPPPLPLGAKIAEQE